MISSVSGISFRGDAPVNSADLINSPGKYATAAPKADIPADTYGDKNKKSHKGGVIATVVALLAAAYIGLGVAVHKGKLNKIDNPEGFTQKVKQFFYSIGESADSLWGKIRNRKTKETSDAPKPKKTEA